MSDDMIAARASIFPEVADTSNPPTWGLCETPENATVRQWACDGLTKITAARQGLQVEWAERIKAVGRYYDDADYRYICEMASRSLDDFERSHRHEEDAYMKVLSMLAMFDPPPFIIVPKP